MNSKMFFIATLVIFFCNTSFAYSDTSIKRFKTSGGFTGFGNAVNTTTKYQPIYLAGDFSWSFRKVPKKATGPK